MPPRPPRASGDQEQGRSWEQGGQGRLPGGGEGLVLNSDIISRIGVSEAGGTTKFYFNEEEMKTIEKEEIAISILSPFPQPQSIARPP